MNTLGIIGYVCMLKSWERLFGAIVLIWFGCLLVRVYKKGVRREIENG